MPSAADLGGITFIMWRLDNSTGCKVSVVDPHPAPRMDHPNAIAGLRFRLLVPFPTQSASTRRRLAAG